MNRKILVTGMAGQIGQILCRELVDQYEFVGIDRRASPSGVPERFHVADISDYDAIRPYFDSVDTVVNLGADPSPHAEWASVLENNIVGTRNVFEAARDAGVRRVVFASSNHVVGHYPIKDEPYRAVYEGRLGDSRHPIAPLAADSLRPDSYYGVSKAFGESLGSYFHDAFGLSVICMRIGWVMTPDDPSFSAAALSLWLSHGDAARFIEKCIEAPRSVGFAIVHGMSDNVLRIWEQATTRDLIGFEPEDGAGDTWTERADAPKPI